MKKFITLFLVALMASTAVAQPYALGWQSDPNHMKHMKMQFVHHPDYSTIHLANVVDLSGIMQGIKIKNPNVVNMDAVYDQKTIGSCTANAGTAAFEFSWHKRYNRFLGGSRLGLYTCSLIHDGTFPNDSGSTTSTVVWVLQNQGMGLESCFPYDVNNLGNDLPTCYLPEAAHNLTLTSYDVASDDHVSIKVALNQGYPVMYGGYVYNAIMNLDSGNYYNPPHDGQGNPVGGHERLIVGYNAKMTHIFNGKLYTGFYWVRNSWGTGWGYHGYCWEPMVEVENTQLNEDFAVISIDVKK